MKRAYFQTFSVAMIFLREVQKVRPRTFRLYPKSFRLVEQAGATFKDVGGGHMVEWR